MQIEKFHKPHWYNLARLNNRTHRKLLVVDGQVALPAAWALRRNGWATRKTPTTGATRTT